MIQHPILKLILAVSICSFISFTLLGQDLKPKDLPSDFGQNNTIILFELMEEVIEKKKNGKVKMNYEISFNRTMKEVLSENNYSGKIVAMTRKELNDMLIDSETDRDKYKYFITYSTESKTGVQKRDETGRQVNLTASIPLKHYTFYMYDIWEEGANYESSLNGAANYKSELRKFLRKLEKEKKKRIK